MPPSREGRRPWEAAYDRLRGGEHRRRPRGGARPRTPQQLRRRARRGRRGPGAGRGSPAATPARRSPAPARPADADGPPARLGRHPDAHADRRRRAVRRAGPADRRRHAGLRREALRPAGLADAAQRGRRGQPRLRADRPPAAGQAVDRHGRVAARLQRLGLARGLGAGRHDRRAARDPRGPPADPLDAARGRRRGAADLRRALARAVADGHARRLRRAVHPRRLRHADLRPRRRPRAPGRRARRRPDRRLPVRPPPGRALVAVRDRRAARARLRGEVVGRLLAGRLRGAHAGLRRDGPARRGGAPALGGDDRARRRAGRLGAGPAPGAGLRRVVVGVVPQRDGHRPQRRRARPRRERHRSGRAVGVRARRAAVAVVLQRARPRLPRGAHDDVERPAPLGVQAVDVADGPAADALLLRLRREGHGLRDRRVHQRRHADRHARAVVAGDPGAGVGVVAGGGPVRLALRRRSRRLRRGHPAVAGQHRPPDVLLLHGAGRAVPGARDDAGDGPDPRPGRRPVGAPADRAAAVGLWVGLVVANFAYLWPILVGVPITQEAWDAQLWLPSWRP